MGITIQAAFLVAITVLGVMQIQSYPMDNGECRTEADCGPGECCVLGMMRYSLPQCLPLGQIEDYCKDDNAPENRTLFYPSGEPVDVYDIYLHVCPCDVGLLCQDNFCATDETYDDNYLY